MLLLTMPGSGMSAFASSMRLNTSLYGPIIKGTPVSTATGHPSVHAEPDGLPSMVILLE